MDKRLLKLASYMLREATEVFSNHGCNDLEEDVMELLDSDILDDINKWNNGDDDWPTEACMVGDSFLMHYLSDKLCAGAESQLNERVLPIFDVSQQRELLVLAFSWVSCIGEQFFDSSKTVEDMVDAFLAKNNCG